MTPSGVHVDDSGGTGPALVLVHGGFCDATHWRHQVGPLSAGGRRVVTLDLPGHGRSARPDSFAVGAMASAVLDVVHRSGAGGCVLVGHSYGSRIVLDAAVRDPAAVGGVVVVDGSRAGTRSDDGAVLAALRDKGADRFVTDLFEDMFVAESDPHVRSEILGALPESDEQKVAGIMSAIVEWDRDELDGVLARLTAPVLAIQSTSYGPDNRRRSLRSDSDRTPYLDLLEATLPAVSVQVVPGIGHFTMLEAPELVTSALAAFTSGI
ncbi:alpha/beta fold hydrolase [Pseudonocardia endophytica]|uniref:alpha/beta fold hydrolase n=1 Tax=Pseudonocardia endophytica TaxID=401976 RepID=UPI001404EF3D|nr:alpha/beta hydrolase [Pseudonocardia endophytica]